MRTLTSADLCANQERSHPPDPNLTPSRHSARVLPGALGDLVGDPNNTEGGLASAVRVKHPSKRHLSSSTTSETGGLAPRPQGHLAPRPRASHPHLAQLTSVYASVRLDLARATCSPIGTPLATIFATNVSSPTSPPTDVSAPSPALPAHLRSSPSPT